MRKIKFNWLRWVVHAAGFFPVALLILDGLTGKLSVNPIQDIIQRMGRAAVYFLIASVAVTPVITLTGWQVLLPRRRVLGLYAFLYAALHFLIFAIFDYGFNIQEIVRQIFEKPFLFIGVIAGAILLSLAVTSFDIFFRRLGKRWQSLHRLVYIAAMAVIVHYTWAKKGNLLSLSGDIWQPLALGLILVLLLVLRIPVVRKWVIHLRHDINGV